MNWRSISRLAKAASLALVVLFFVATIHLSTRATPQSPKPAAADEPFAAGTLIEPDHLVGTLSQSKEKPPVICVGFKALFQGAHVPGALYLGPARTADGLDTLHKWAENLSRKKMIVIYCGCCPWEHCPNIRPAYSELQKMGFTNIKVLHIGQDFAKDWVDKGFPVDKAQ